MEDINIIDNQVIHDFHPFFHVYENGVVKRLMDTPIVPPSPDPDTGVLSKDVIISQHPKVSARLYLPTATSAAGKLPLLIYFHGGAFSIESAFSTIYHTHLNTLTAAAGVVAVSVEYRLAPEHPIPACYEDCWDALKWVQQSSDPWIQSHSDLNRVFLAGDSAGANIAHNIAVRVGLEEVGPGLKIVGLALVHPYFEFGEPDKLWMHICEGSSGVNDPRINPAAEPGLLEKIACGKVQVFVAGEDSLKESGWRYYETLKNSGWNGDVDIVECEGEDHVFHLVNPNCEAAQKLVSLLASFLQLK